MRIFVALLWTTLAMTGLAGLPACEKTPSCHDAVERWWATAVDSGMNPAAVEEYIGRDLALCLDLQNQARESDCMAAHVSWRECLYNRIGAGAFSWTSECAWRLERLEACLDDRAFEERCDDDLDNDADGLVDCFDPDCSPLCWGSFGSPPTSVPQSLDRAVDLLFVIDNSGSMADEQANTRGSFPAYFTSLKSMVGGLPDVHLGVTSTDLGTGMFQITYCEEEGGDGGALVTGNCANPTGAPYIVDVKPRGCEITMDQSNVCLDHTCTQTHCAHEPSTTYVQDPSTGCPRCRNYEGESLEDVFSCIADLGTMGCGFEQPLEAMRRALEPTNTANAGFLRDNAVLAVLLLTDEDDCSASDPQLYDNTQTDIDSTLGPLTSYRCFEHGVTCDINLRTHEGTRQNCVPREDPSALLHPLSSYIQFLQGLKAPQEMVVVAIAGPVTPSPTGEGLNMNVELDDQSRPELQYSCTTVMDGAVPGIRIHNLVAAFNEEEELLNGAYTSVCSADYAPALAAMGNRIKDILDFQCLPAPPRGCADVGVEFGTPRASQTCAINERCLPTCSVGEIRYRGTADEYDVWLPPCLEVCADGYCEGNTDRSLAYAEGHPPDRDPDLPVEVCWHVVYNPNCPNSNYAELRASRRADPPPRTFLLYNCMQLLRDEQLCNDGVDNDEDCLIDTDDPCCQSGMNCME
jgi:hypothetical protein